MDNYSSDDDVVSPTMKRRRVQVLSSSSEDVSDEYTQSDTQTDTSTSEDSDSEGDESGKENQDTNVTWGITGGTREPFRFSVNPGQQQTVPRRFRNKCLFYMEKYLDDVFISVIVAQTNLYADQFLQSHPNLQSRSRMRKWHPTNNNEIRCFIAILILQGIVKKTNSTIVFF
ncbi:PiggyBac transposable element-derived protein 4 [Anthophora quadrimaculata]